MAKFNNLDPPMHKFLDFWHGKLGHGRTTLTLSMVLYLNCDLPFLSLTEKWVVHLSIYLLIMRHPHY